MTGTQLHFDPAFRELMHVMTTTPVLAFSNNVDPCILDTDGSDVAIGAALYQLRNGTLRPISFASHTLARDYEAVLGAHAQLRTHTQMSCSAENACSR